MPGCAPVGAGHVRPGGVPWTGVCGKVQGRALRGCEHGATVERSETGERAMFAPAGQTTARACQLCWLTALVVRRQAPGPYVRRRFYVRGGGRLPGGMYAAPTVVGDAYMRPAGVGGAMNVCGSSGTPTPTVGADSISARGVCGGAGYTGGINPSPTNYQNRSIIRIILIIQLQKKIICNQFIKIY